MDTLGRLDLVVRQESRHIRALVVRLDIVHIPVLVATVERLVLVHILVRQDIVELADTLESAAIAGHLDTVGRLVRLVRLVHQHTQVHLDTVECLGIARTLEFLDSAD